MISAKKRIVRLFDRIFLRNLIRRSIFHFYTLSFKGSPIHKMRVAAFGAIGFGVVLIQILTQNLVGVPLKAVSWSMASIPFTLSIFLLIGLRDSISLPISLPANWIFRLTEAPQIRRYFSGLRQGIILTNMLPLFAGLFCFYFFLWDIQLAALHVVFSFSVALLMLEIALLSWYKIPFACSYLPGKERLQLFWLGYLALCLVVVNALTWMDMRILRSPALLAYFVGATALVIGGIRLYQKKILYKGTSIQFEEEPPPAMVDLSYRAPAHKRGPVV